jgi:hypothetical protein
VLLPEERSCNFRRHELTISDSCGHQAEWIRAAKTGAPTGSNFEYAG